jgi:hypothetical protein
VIVYFFKGMQGLFESRGQTEERLTQARKETRERLATAAFLFMRDGVSSERTFLLVVK